MQKLESCQTLYRFSSYNWARIEDVDESLHVMLLYSIITIIIIIIIIIIIFFFFFFFFGICLKCNVGSYMPKKVSFVSYIKVSTEPLGL